MSSWKVIVPESTVNMVLNPSAETTGNFATAGLGGTSRSTTYQHYGLYSYRVQTTADGDGIELTLSFLSNLTYYVTMRVAGTLPPAWDWSLDGSTFNEPELLEQIDSTWALYGFEFPSSQAGTSVLLEIHQDGAGTGDFYIDGIQVEQKEYWTSYCDGSQEGCEWLGSAHAATSQRSANSRAGGRVLDLQTDYSFNISGMTGFGKIPANVSIDEYALHSGGRISNVKETARSATLVGFIDGTNYADLHAKKQALETLFDAEAHPNSATSRLQYWGATVHKQIDLVYEDGLGGNIQATDPCHREQIAIRFIAPDPFWQEIGESAVPLSTSDSFTFRTVAGRLSSTGQWDALGPPNAAGTFNSIDAIAEDDTYVYFGGDFLNFDNIANADYIVRWHKQNQTWSALDVGLNNTVKALAIAPNGTLYIGGSFTDAGGVAAADYLCTWDGTNFAAVGTPLTGAAVINSVEALLFDLSGNLYIGGDFLNWGNIAAADTIVMWNGSSYSALSTGTNNVVLALALGSDNTIYIGGNFTSPGNYITSWNGSAFTNLGTGVDTGTGVIVLVVNRSTHILYGGGNLTQVGGNAANYVFSWNGSSYSALSSGMDNNVLALAVGPDNLLYAGGSFTSAGGVALADRVARWNASTWAHLDIDLPGSPQVSAVHASQDTDPVVNRTYDIFLGFTTSGTGTFGGIATATNEGNVPAKPKIIFARSGGTTAVIETLRNERTGMELLFNYSLLSGETLVVDLDPLNLSVISSFFGPRPDALLKGSDEGDWELLAGANNVTSYINETGAPTLVTYMLWKDKYKGQD